MTPLSSDSYGGQLTMNEETHEATRYARLLFAHQIKTGDLSEMYALGIKALVREGEQLRTTCRRRGHRKSAHPRHIPVHVKRAVWQRDGGRCTFTSEDGRRCEADTNLEFDHIVPVAKGGEASADNLRLLCRAHNHFAAEQTFGSEFVRHKRIAAEEFREAAQREAERKAAKRKSEAYDEMDVVPWLRALKFSAAEARMAAERCADMPAEATLEERIKRALQCIRVRGTKHVPAPHAIGGGPAVAIAPGP